MVGAIHFDQLQRHGGKRGVRDEGMIQSALARPRNKLAHDSRADLATLAAAYGFGLTQNHGFVDGNERVAFMVIFVSNSTATKSTLPRKGSSS
jgi:death-on-curing protein